MKMRSTVPMRVAKIGYIVMSAVFCVSGLIIMTHPDVSAGFLMYVLGVAMIVFGAVKIVGYFSKDLFRLAFQYDLEFGIILIVLGSIVLLRPGDVLNFIVIASGIAILADALFKIRIALDSKAFGIGSWWMILALALLTGAVGITLIVRPWDSARMLTALLGVSLLSEGALNLFVAIGTVKIVKNQYPDRIDAEFYETEEFEK